MCALAKNYPKYETSMRYRRAFIYLVVFAFSASGCETTKSDQQAAEAALGGEQAPGELSQAELAELVKKAESLRDRELQKLPEFEAVSAIGALGSAEVSEAVRGEQRLLGAQLFGSELFKSQAPGRLPAGLYANIARYDAQEGRILYVASEANREVLKRAVFAALVEAIGQQHGEGSERAESWDEALAHTAGEQASVLWALGAAKLAETEPEYSLESLAGRPELILEMEELGDRLNPPEVSRAKPIDRAGFEALAQYFVARDALKLGAALYRSGGWSGVELAGAIRPGRTIDVARPDLWIGGEAVAEWLWPVELAGGDEGGEAAAELLQEGEVGAHLLAIWLSGVADSALVQSIHAGYLSDSYRFYPAESAPEEAAPRFEWLTMWNSPASAGALARAFELAMRERYGVKEGGPAPFTVFSRGLIVGVIVEPDDSEGSGEQARRERAEQLLDGHKVELKARKPLPIKFVPTRADAHVEAMASASLKDRVWEGREANLKFDLSALGDDWRVQQPDLSELRWFARHEDGAILQLTVELDNPLGPGFKSDAYRERVANKLKDSMSSGELRALDAVAEGSVGALDGAGFVVQVNGALEGADRVLKLWQFQRDDLILSYSLQAPPESFKAHEEAARAILAKVERLNGVDEPTPQKEEGVGSIEYQVED